ncbi:MAG: ABC transporter ATP-binding protein [Parvibaculaceae bacterium]
MTYTAPFPEVAAMTDFQPSTIPAVRLSALSKTFAGHVAVDQVNLDIFAGDFVAILGPSGCGKTTLLRLLGGFLTPDSGAIAIDGKDVTKDGPERRPTNTVFQGYGLFPHMTVRQNVAYGLRISGRLAPAEIREQVDAALGLVRMSDYAERNSRALSGGQQQRVALARALVMRPRVLLLDESLAALDLKLRQQMQDELRRIHREIGGTFVFVTHDQNEAFFLANKVAVMNNGRIEQFASPSDVYHRPKTRFVATFVGEANVINGRRENGIVAIYDGRVLASPGPDGDVEIMIRPEDVKVGERPSGPAVTLPARLVDQVFQGSFLKLTFADAAGRQLTATLGESERIRSFAIGEALDLSWGSDKTMVFDRG